MTRSEELKAIMENVISCHYTEDDFRLFQSEYGWADWMNDYCEGEELDERESKEIDDILKEGFRMAFDEAWREVYQLSDNN